MYCVILGSCYPCVTGYHSNKDWAASCQDGVGYVSFHLHLSHNLVYHRGTTWDHGNQLPPPFFVFSSVYYIANWKACPLSDVLPSIPFSTSPSSSSYCALKECFCKTSWTRQKFSAMTLASYFSHVCYTALETPYKHIHMVKNAMLFKAGLKLDPMNSTL